MKNEKFKPLEAPSLPKSIYGRVRKDGKPDRRYTKGLLMMRENLNDVSGTNHKLKKEIESNKFNRGAKDGKHYWLTPPDLYKELDGEFGFDFDPCPYPLPDGFDGLTQEWGKSNYVNPPFGAILHNGKKKGATAWARKAIEEHKKGKTVVMVYPIDKWVLMLIKEGAEIRNLGDIKWLAIEDGTQGKGTGRHIACFVLNKKNKIDKGVN